jgi:hypothetical protein
MAWDHIARFCSLTADNRVAVVQAHIAATDSGSLGLNQDLVGFRLRTFTIGDNDLLITGENYCTHFEPLSTLAWLRRTKIGCINGIGAGWGHLCPFEEKPWPFPPLQMLNFELGQPDTGHKWTEGPAAGHVAVASAHPRFTCIPDYDIRHT